MPTPVVLVLVLLVAVVRAAIDLDTLWSEYTHVPTACESPRCVAGGCLYENCEQPVSCPGGMCFFRCVQSLFVRAIARSSLLTRTSSATFSVVSANRNCKEAVCEGGVCVFDHTAEGRCPGGACRFQNTETTLTEGYCAGGACTLEGQAHPASFAATLSE